MNLGRNLRVSIVALAMMSTGCTGAAVTDDVSEDRQAPAAAETVDVVEVQLEPIPPTGASTLESAVFNESSTLYVASSVEALEHPVLELMASTPAPEGGFSGVAVNYRDLFAEAAIDQQSLCGDKGAFADALRTAASGMEIATTFLNPYTDAKMSDLDDIERSFGFSYCDINATFVARLPTVVIHVDSQPDEIVAAAQADDRWSDLLDVTTPHNLTVLEWGFEVSETSDRTPSAMFPSPWGGGALAIRGNAVLKTSGLNHLDPVLDDAWRLAVPAWSVLGSGSVQQTATQMIAEGSNHFYITDQPYRYQGLSALPPHSVVDEDGLTKEAEEVLAPPSVGLPLWTSLAIGIRHEGDQRVGVVVISHLSDADAEKSAERYPAALARSVDEGTDLPLADFYQLRSIRTDGAMMIAELTLSDLASSLNVLTRPIDMRGSLYAVRADPEQG